MKEVVASLRKCSASCEEMVKEMGGDEHVRWACHDRQAGDPSFGGAFRLPSRNSPTVDS